MPKYNINPFFMDSEQGQLFAIYYASISADNAHCIIHIPAFFEEMNKSRHMITKQAGIFAEQGCSVLVFDLWGTGDSQGEFSNATWTIWLQNIQTVINWVQAQGINTISFWGLRAGVLLALDFLQQSSFNIKHLICWQPVLNGETFIMQFLRLKVAAAMMDKNAPQEKTSDLRQQLKNGQFIEVAGYLLNPDLVLPLLALKAKQLNALNINQCEVFELVSSPDATASHTCLQWLEQLKQQKIDASLELIQGSLFWTTQEIVEVPRLIESTASKGCCNMCNLIDDT